MYIFKDLRCSAVRKNNLSRVQCMQTCQNQGCDKDSNTRLSCDKKNFIPTSFNKNKNSKMLRNMQENTTSQKSDLRCF